MENLTGSNKTPPASTSVALGLFDGVHLGHRAVLNKTLEFEKENLASAIFTFSTNSIPSKHNKKFEYILDNETKLNIIQKLGIKYAYSPDFLNFKELSAEAFVKLVLVDKLRAKKVICGKKFHFGKGAVCGFDELYNLGLKYGFEAVVVPPVMSGGKPISSTIIRELIKNGEIVKANKLLGYNYYFEQIVSHGNKIGRTLNFPTINQYFKENQLVPRYGVYASYTYIEGEKFLSVTNIGVKPTVQNDKRPLAETHILNYKGNLYGKIVNVVLYDFIRSECKFNSLEELKRVISEDIENVKSILVKFGGNLNYEYKS